MCRNGSRTFRSVMGLVLVAAAVAGCLGGPTDEESGEAQHRPRPCGGIQGLRCRGNTYCAYAEDQQCGADYQLGVCAPRPEACVLQSAEIQTYEPVCGCDGQSYGSACAAASAGMSVSHGGECAPRACGGLLDLQCAQTEYCAYTIEQMCGAGDQEGICSPRPEACALDVDTLVYDPVCGCDNQTHGSACIAASAGVSVLHAGECVIDCDPSSPCPEGMICQLDGDIGGHGRCVAGPSPEQCGDLPRCPDGYNCLECFGDPLCMPPDTYCAF